MIRLLIASVLLFLFDLYAFQALQSYFQQRWVKVAFLGVSTIVSLLLLYMIFVDRSVYSTHVSNAIIGAFVTLFVAKMILSSFMLVEDIGRLVEYGITRNKVESYPSRRKFISAMAIGAAAIPFAGMLYGIFRGRYRFRVIKHTLFFDDLPDTFDGYKITHLSDFHTGSFDNFDKVKYGIDLVNEQESDVILFTGDLVNVKASEVDPWKDLFATLKAKDGVFSVLGNHDYGDYVRWESPEAKKNNFEALKAVQKEMGFNLLLNRSEYIHRGQDKLAIVGVENWGEGFVKKGNLKQAVREVGQDDFCIVMSHDPTHWEKEILHFPKQLQLTLSGHTHGMQFGIEIPGWIKWSPASLRYKQWAGVYEKAGRKINVNRGFGYLAFPGRTGIWPEITQITLKKSV